MKVGNFVQSYISERVLPIWCIFLLDVFIVAFSVLLAYLLRYSVDTIFLPSSSLGKSMLWITLVNIIFFRVFHTYANILRFSSFVDILHIFVSLTVSYLLLFIGCLITEVGFDFEFLPISTLIISYVISFAVMAGVRVVIKIIYEHLNFDGQHGTNVFIFGTREYGVDIAKSIRSKAHYKYRLKGFISSDPDFIGKIIMGVKVYPYDGSILANLIEKNIKSVIVTPYNMDKLKDSDFTEQLLANNIKILIIPNLSEWNSSNSHGINQLKELQIEDLLQRDTIQIDMQKIASHLEGKRVMITGAAGSIGSEIVRQVASFNPFDLILIDQAETPLHDIRLELQSKWMEIKAETIVADISNASRMEEIFKDYRPQYVFHAAAYKHVPMMEDNASEAIQNNVAGTRILADLAVKYKTEKFVMISTDKAVNPSNVMGCSKRICEIYVQSLAKKLEKEGIKTTQFITTRFGNVLGSNGSVIPLFRKQIEKGGPVTVTHPEIIRYFMTIPEACRLVLEAGSMGNGGEIFIFDMGKPVKILDLAKQMISLSGRTDVQIKFTGLRHGEKLYEVLLNDKEHTKPTYNEKIMIADVREYDYDEVKVKIHELEEIAATYDQMKIVEKMKELVPEYVSKNSIFEQLDHKDN
ncbi:MAG: polysaccharide biosynthesis protein [Bacteroidaceae bacterium]|nr:polysaccharide biosynthesis protein [Bacteroidaceae bacterium]